MWEKISKEMQLPWRAAEAMHWQIGEVEMAQRANVPVFHLAGQPGSASMHGGDGSDDRMSTSPSSGIGSHSHVAYAHTHNHSLPSIQQTLGQSVSPVQTRWRRNSSDSSPTGSTPLRHRADSARSVPSSSTLSRATLPSVGEITGTSAPPTRYTLPPVASPSGGHDR